MRKFATFSRRYPDDMQLTEQRQSDRKLTISESARIKSSSNVLLPVLLAELARTSFVNLVLSILTLAYIGINIVCIVLNGYDNDECPSVFNQEACPDAATSLLTFHLLEFWGTFGFAVVEVVSLIYSPRGAGNIFKFPLLLKLVVFINVVVTLVCALLVTLNLERFEVISHELEYSNELTMAFFDMAILFTLLKSHGIWTKSDSTTQLVLVCVAAGIAIAQLAVYNGMGETPDGGRHTRYTPLHAITYVTHLTHVTGETPDGDKKGEVAAHYMEFAFEILSSLVTFWFCMDNKLLADTQTVQLLTLDEESGAHVRLTIGSDRELLVSSGPTAI